MTAPVEPEAIAFNPFEPGYFDDPYTRYAALREREPVHRSVIGAWMLFRYEDVAPFLRNPALSVEDDNAIPTQEGISLRRQLDEMAGDRGPRGQRAMLNVDPPDHTRLRRLVQKAFTPRMIEGLRPLVQSLVDDALDRVAGDEMDVIADLAFPLPFQVITKMLGMPEGDAGALRDWSHTLTKTIDPMLSADDFEAVIEASDHMIEHVAAAVEWKRRNPADDLLSALIAAEDEGDVLSDQELMDQVVLLFIAGHETTVNLIGNGTLALLRHRPQLERLQADPGLDVAATEELLRYDSPVQFTRRITLTDIDVAGQAIEAGSFVLACLGSANRDPARWGEDADRLDLGRAGANQHVSFGGGAHHCLGAALAKLEGAVALGTLVRRFPAIELASEAPAWNGRVVLRGLDTLPVTLAIR